MTALSILIPGRAEEFMARTCQDILSHLEGDTEIIAVIDGQAAGPALPVDPRLRVITLAEPIGQRAAQNLAAKSSTAKYVMKLDAHCAVDQGFDRKMMAVMEDDMTIVPLLRNLHVFNWVCDFCGWFRYQGPKPAACEECKSDGEHIQQKIVWNAKTNPQNTAYRFNKNLQFKYFGPLAQMHKGLHGLQETMSLQGSCFMATREAYWARELCDESWGSWGQQGSEVAIKTWLSGGRVMSNLDTWYGHLFRTQPGFGFPYPNSGHSQERARAISQDIFLNDRWHKQTRPLAWLLERFWEPLSRIERNDKDLDDWEARWQRCDIDALKARPFTIPATGARYVPAVTKGMIYYTDNQLPEAIAAPVRDRLVAVSRERHMPLVTAALRRRLTFGTKNIVLPSLKRGHYAMFKQILAALENSRSDVVFFCEHDVLYHASHFDFTPPDPAKVYYNLNLWQVRASDGHAVYWDAKRVSQLCGYRELLLAHYRKRLALVEVNGFSMAMGYEPGSHNRAERVDDLQSDTWRSAVPNLDIKHGGNLTPAKWTLADFRTAPTGWREVDSVPGWEPLKELAHA